MSEFTISPANPIHFEIQTGTGTINDGVTTIDGNFLFGEIGDYWNCSNLGQKGYCQKYNADDTTTIQFIFDNTGYIPYVELIDSDSAFVAVIAWTNISGDIYESDIDWSVYGEGCYQIRISSIQGTGNFLPCADSGTFETGTYASFGFSTGGTNTGTKSSAQAQSGTFSARIASPMVPTAAETEIGFCTASFSLVSGTIYRYSAYIFDDGTNPFVVDNRTVGIDITDFSDAVVISETFVTPSVDGRGQWLFIDKWFRAGSDTSGQIKITTSATPQGNGLIYVDTIEINEASEVLEAESGCIDVKTNHSCTAFITYGNDTNAFGIYYDGGASFGLRLGTHAIKFKMDDPDFKNEDDSLGQNSIVRSVNYKTYELETEPVPPALIETLCLALKHDNFTLRGVPLVCQTGNIGPDWDDNTYLGTVTVDLRVKDYNQQNGNC